MADVSSVQGITPLAEYKAFIYGFVVGWIAHRHDSQVFQDA